MRRLVHAFVLLALAAACSGSRQRAPSLSSVAPTSTSPPSSSPTAPPSSSVTVSSSTAPPPERCGASSLAVALVDGRAALGHGLDIFELRNTSARPCRLAGYPGVELLDPGSRVLAQGERRPGYILGDRPPSPVTIAPGAAAYFGVEFLNACPDDQPAGVSDRLRAIPPDDTAAVLVPARITVCTKRDILVSPVRQRPDEVARF